MKYAFITGIPTAGKTFLADKVAKQLGITHIQADHWRDELKNDPEFLPWVNFFWDKDEHEYWNTNTCDTHWEDFIAQAEKFWPVFKRKILLHMETKQPAIFEGVYLLPRFLKELNINGIVMIGRNPEETYSRIKKLPRWGSTKELQRIEAEMFYFCKGAKYKEDGEAHGFPVFADCLEAEKQLLKFFE